MKRRGVLLLLLAAVPAAAGDDPTLEKVKLHGAAMKAQMRIAELLREKGDDKGAMQAYARAVEIFEELGERRAGPAVARGLRPGAAKDAVALALKWLADHQDVDGDGKWDADEFMKHDPPRDRCDGKGGALYDVGVTGLSLMAFLGAGFTDRGARHDNPYAKNVRMGLRYLMASQDANGCFGTRATHSFMYNHVIATMALCEAYALTRNPRYRKPAQDGLNFIAKARNPFLAWRYEPRGAENDTSVTAWCTSALKAGQLAGLAIDPAAFKGARVWIDKMTEPNFGQVGYNFAGGAPARPEGKQDKFPPEKSQSMTAAGILTRILCGEDPRRSDVIRKGAALCLEAPPRWADDGSIDMYYWYYGTLAMSKVGGAQWARWNRHLQTALLKSQHGAGSGSRTGSWGPAGPWGDDGGRVYSTALMALCLEVSARAGEPLVGRGGRGGGR